MLRQRLKALPVLAAAVLAGVGVPPVLGQYGGVADTVHNLSVSGPGEIRSVTETRICRFCHIPHNAEIPEALWSRKLSDAQYVTPEIRGRDGARVRAPQPNGSSRLCLSCHDGTIALGDVSGRKNPILFQGATRLQPGRPGFLGTDLSGSHPISFKITDAELTADDGAIDMVGKPLGVILESKKVALDAAGRMQCTTCHDPHDDSSYENGKVPRFWVAPTVNEVCLECHALR